MSEDDARRKIHLVLTASSIQDSRFTSRTGRAAYTVEAKFVADTEDYALWELINNRLVNHGLALYESESIHEEVLASVVSGHEQEKAVLGDQLREARDAAAILGQQLTQAQGTIETLKAGWAAQEAELERLRALERDISMAALLLASASGKIAL
jgi:hypothetical protein